MTNEERAALVDQLRVDVFYGDARLANQKRHNPLHMYAADQIEADGKRIAELEEALRSLIENYAPISEPGYLWPKARKALGETK